MLGAWGLSSRAGPPPRDGVLAASSQPLGASPAHPPRLHPTPHDCPGSSAQGRGQVASVGGGLCSTVTARPSLGPEHRCEKGPPQAQIIVFARPAAPPRAQ